MANVCGHPSSDGRFDQRSPDLALHDLVDLWSAFCIYGTVRPWASHHGSHSLYWWSRPIPPPPRPRPSAMCPCFSSALSKAKQPSAVSCLDIEVESMFAMARVKKDLLVLASSLDSFQALMVHDKGLGTGMTKFGLDLACTLPKMVAWSGSGPGARNRSVRSKWSENFVGTMEQAAGM